MNRRYFLMGLAGTAAARLSGASGPRVDGAALDADLRALSIFGRPAGGTFQSGVSRIGYSDADIAGRKFVMDLMRRAGAAVRVDAAGNIFAERRGREARLAAGAIRLTYRLGSERRQLRWRSGVAVRRAPLACS